MSLNGLYGRIEKTRAKLFPYHEVSNYQMSQKEYSTRMHSFHDLNISPICNNKLIGSEVIIDPKFGKLPVLMMKSLFYYETCNWEWKRGFTMTFREKNEFSIYKELQMTFDSLRRQIPELSIVETERKQQYFIWDFEDDIKQSMIQQEEDMKVFYMKMSEGESAPLIDIITNFVNKFQTLCDKKSIKKRKNIISKFILLLCDKAKEYELWTKDWNEDMFIMHSGAYQGK